MSRWFQRGQQPKADSRQQSSSGQRIFKLADPSSNAAGVIQVCGGMVVKVIVTSTRPGISLKVQPELAEFAAQIAGSLAPALVPTIEVALVPLTEQDVRREQAHARVTERGKFEPVLKFLARQEITKLVAENRPLRVVIDNAEALQKTAEITLTRDRQGNLQSAIRKLK
jgi:hypothetical protein